MAGVAWKFKKEIVAAIRVVSAEFDTLHAGGGGRECDSNDWCLVS